MFWIPYVLLGLAIGSFLNICIDRLPQRQPVLRLFPHCSACLRPLAVTDLIPVLSYVLLGGKCRYCGVPIPARIMIVEATTGAIFGFLWLWLGPGLQLAVASLYASLLIIVAFIDIEHGLILNKVMYPAILLSPVAAVAYGMSVQSVLLGGLIGLGLMLLPYLASRGGLGAGDVKLGAFVGIMSGFPNILVAMFAAAILGGVATAFLLITGKKGRKEAIPFGPFLVFGAVTAFVWGERILEWYVGRML